MPLSMATMRKVYSARSMAASAFRLGELYGDTRGEIAHERIGLQARLGIGEPRRGGFGGRSLQRPRFHDSAREIVNLEPLFHACNGGFRLLARYLAGPAYRPKRLRVRSEAPRVGNACVSTCSSRCLAYQ